MENALVTDSSALLTPSLVEDHAVEVVPVTISIDGVEYEEGVDLGPDAFYDRLAGERTPQLATSQPSPGRFLECFEALRERGARHLVAVLVGSAYSGTVDSARVAAARASVPVTVIDSGQASFGVGLCVLEAAAALSAGMDPAEIEQAVLARSATIESVFIIQAIELARASGRFEQVSLHDRPAEAIPVLKFAQGQLTNLGDVATSAEAVELMSSEVLSSASSARPVRVASGLADPATKPITEALEARLADNPLVSELLRYRVGPSVAANTGPGTAGVFYHQV